MCINWIESFLKKVATETGIGIETVKQIAAESENEEQFWLKISTSQRK